MENAHTEPTIVKLPSLDSKGKDALLKIYFDKTNNANLVPKGYDKKTKVLTFLALTNAGKKFNYSMRVDDFLKRLDQSSIQIAGSNNI